MPDAMAGVPAGRWGHSHHAAIEADGGDGDAGVTSDGAPDVDGAADSDASLADGG